MKIFIANFPFDLTEEDICDLFKIFGEVTDCKMVKDETGKSKGYGFVEFREDAHAKMAIKKMHNVRVAGRQVAVTLSTSESTAVHHQKKQKQNS
jgi:RNA recognition motif-containing protein